MSVATRAYEPLKLQGKLRLLLACALSVGLFWPLGRIILTGRDPLAALSLVGRPHLFFDWLYMTAMAVVAACVGTALIGGRRAFGGTFAAAVGLAALNLQFGTVERVLADAGTDPGQRKLVFVGLLGETLLWTVSLVAAFFAEQVVGRWIGAHSAGAGGGAVSVGSGDEERSAPGWAHGLIAVGIVATVAVLIISKTIARTDAAVVQRNQVYFALCVAFFLGCLVSCQVIPRAADVWHLLAPAVVGCLGCLWGWWQPIVRGLNEYYQAIPELPPNWLVRAMPVEYLSVGLIGASLGVWFGRRLAAARHAGGAP